LPNKKQEAPKDSKPIDSLLKALFGEQSEEIILYCLLPTMKHATVNLLTRAVREMHEWDDQAQSRRHLVWFHIMLGRTTTISQPEDKQKIQEVLKMQYPGYALFREDPVIGGMILEGERKGELRGKIEGEIKGELRGKIEGELEGLRKAILDVAEDLFSPPVVVQVQQAIAPSQDAEQLRKFLRQLVRLSDDQAALALLTQCFPEGKLKGKIEGIQDSILDIVSARFSPQVVAQVQQAIAPNEDVHQLRTFLQQVVRLSDEQEVSALLIQLFPNAQEAQ